MPLVLIVDDDPGVLRLVRLLLETSGYETMTAANGAEALDQMREHLPCLVLLDMNMPVMDGFEFRRQQLADRALARVPVLCLTGHYEPEQVGMQLGVPCLKKPLHFPDVVNAVQAKCGSGTSLTDGKALRNTPIGSD